MRYGPFNIAGTAFRAEFFLKITHNLYIVINPIIIYMDTKTDPKMIGLLAVLIGILMLIYPFLVGYLVGIFLVIYGLLKVFT